MGLNRVRHEMFTVPYSGRNLVINGDFSVWQRGTVVNDLNHTFLADRWKSETVTTGSMTREDFTLGQTDVPDNPTHFLRYTKTGTGDYAQISHKIENVVRFNGNYVTLSFWAKVDANVTGEVRLTRLFAGSTFGTLPVIVGGSNTITLTTSWQKFVLTFSVPNDVPATPNGNDYLGLQIWPGGNNTGWTGTFDLAQVQLEINNIDGEPTDFEYVDPGTQLMRCQRYYQQIPDIFLAGYTTTGTALVNNMLLPVTMRDTPVLNYSIGVTSLAQNYTMVANTKKLSAQSQSVNNPGVFSVNFNDIRLDAEL